jgi:hypothetical protein
VIHEKVTASLAIASFATVVCNAGATSRAFLVDAALASADTLGIASANNVQNSGGTMRLIIALCAASLATSHAAAREAHTFPTTLPPVVATAAAKAKGDTLTIGITYPQSRWQLDGEFVPKEKWPTLKVEVERVEQALTLGGPSQLAESKVVDLDGKELTHEEIAKRLAQQTLVLIAADGKFPSSYYRTLLKPDTLIIQLGPRDGAPAPSMLAAEKRE